MSADEPTPVADFLHDTFAEADVDPAQIALFASFVFVGIGIGAIFTVVAITRGVSPEQVQSGPFVEQTVIEMHPSDLYAARDRVLLASAGGFAACSAYVAAVLYRRGEVSEA